MDKNQLGMDRLLQDLWWRQRNIVFPDTVRNEGMFYRSLGRDDQSRDSLQRVGTMMVAAVALVAGCWYLAAAIGTIAALGLPALIPAIICLGGAIIGFVIGVKLAMAAVFNGNRRKVHPRIIERRRISGRR